MQWGGTEEDENSKSTSGSWCEPGTEWKYSGSITGNTQEDASYDVKGKVQYKGQEMCKAVYTHVEDEEVTKKLNYYFTQGKEKVCLESIDPETGEILHETCIEN